MNKISNGWWGLPAGVLALTGVSGGVSLVLASMGLPIMHEEKAPEKAPEAPAEVVAQWQQSPAMAGLSKALNAPPKGWQANGRVLTSPQFPYPFSCSTDGVNPALTLSRSYQVNGQPVQVMTTAYTAGMGKQGLQNKINNAYSCAGNDASIAVYASGDIGAESYQADVYKTGMSNKEIIWRYGDVVTFVVTNPGNGAAYSLANDFNEHMLKQLNGTCAAADYTEKDMGRTPWSGAEFTGLFTDKKVTIKERKLPKVPADAKYEEVDIPAPSIALKDVELPVKPTAYPVWPELPKEMNKPTEPKAPAAKAPTATKAQIKIEDEKGPGCGWSFTGATAPVFDKAAADDFNTKATEAAKTKLEKAAAKWQKDVLTYWEDYDKFSNAAPKWNDYVDEVNMVKEAWAEIETDWANYYVAKEAFDTAVADREAFLSRQKAAESEYNALLEQCAVQAEEDAQKAAEEAKKEKEEEKKNANNPSPSPSASPSDEADEEETDEDRIACPPVKPEIIDQAPPLVPEEPKAPADPRPKSER